MSPATKLYKTAFFLALTSVIAVSAGKDMSRNRPGAAPDPREQAEPLVGE